MTSIKTDRVHFQTFDALRFLSFLLVFLHHSPIPATHFLHKISQAGGIGVSFFFVLSGFLITYLLILEKLNSKDTISLPKFFIRRILRIWPLYYAMVLFAFCTPYILNLLHLTASDEGYEPQWFFTLTFLENYVMMYTDSFPNVSPLRVMWSLCIEEHFYIIWGVVFSIISLKNIPKFLVGSILFTIISRVVYQNLNLLTGDILTNIGYFAFGGIPAYLFVFKLNIIQKLAQIPALYKYIFALFTLIVIIVDSNYFALSDVSNFLLFATLFSLLILCTLGEKNVFKISDKTILAFLGKYTYGLYLFHTIFINLFLKMGSMYNLHWFTIIVLSLLFTIISSYISYHLFEKRFLKLKIY